MGEYKTVAVGGVVAVDAGSNPELSTMFADDCKGTLGWLVRPYQEAAVTLRFSAAKNAWTLVNKETTFLGAGQGQPWPEAGFVGDQPDDATSLLRNGCHTSSTSFTALGMSLRLSGLAYVPDLSEALPSGRVLVSRDGVLSSLPASFAEDVMAVLLENSLVELYQDTRKYFVTLGRAETFNAETPVQFKRLVTLPPNTDGAPVYLIRLRTSRALAIPRDKEWAAPEDGALVTMTLLMELDGYCSTSDGLPLFTHDDVREVAASQGR